MPIVNHATTTAYNAANTAFDVASTAYNPATTAYNAMTTAYNETCYSNGVPILLESIWLYACYRVSNSEQHIFESFNLVLITEKRVT